MLTLTSHWFKTTCYYHVFWTVIIHAFSSEQGNEQMLTNRSQSLKVYDRPNTDYWRHYLPWPWVRWQTCRGRNYSTASWQFECDRRQECGPLWPSCWPELWHNGSTADQELGERKPAEHLLKIDTAINFNGLLENPRDQTPEAETDSSGSSCTKPAGKTYTWHMDHKGMKCCVDLSNLGE